VGVRIGCAQWKGEPGNDAGGEYRGRKGGDVYLTAKKGGGAQGGGDW